MKSWRKFWTLSRWTHVFKRLPKLIASPRVPLRDKLLFIVPAIVYWIIPDIMPFIPIDDMAVTLLLMNMFVSRAEKNMET